MTDIKGDWSFSEATGELTLDAGTDYDAWGEPYGLATGSEAGDPDNDGVTNQEEYAFGLIPNSGASVNPITVQLDKATTTFSYTRRDCTNTDLIYSVWYSTDLSVWFQDTGATHGAPALSGEVETVQVTLSNLPARSFAGQTLHPGPGQLKSSPHPSINKPTHETKNHPSRRHGALGISGHFTCRSHLQRNRKQHRIHRE